MNSWLLLDIILAYIVKSVTKLLLTDIRETYYWLHRPWDTIFFSRQYLFLNVQHMIFKFNNCMIFTCQFENKLFRNIKKWLFAFYCIWILVLHIFICVILFGIFLRYFLYKKYIINNTIIYKESKYRIYIARKNNWLTW